MKGIFIVVFIIALSACSSDNSDAQNDPIIGQSDIASNGDFLEAQKQAGGRHVDVAPYWLKPPQILAEHVPLAKLHKNGTIPHITIEPQGNTPLADINSGKLDTYFHQLGADLKNLGYEIWVRPMQEENGDFMPWSPRKNGQTEQDYINAFRRIYNIIKVQENATNAKFEYNVNNGSGGGNTFMGQYPGDAYCDFVGMDGYNWGTGASGWTSYWETFEEVFGVAYAAITTTGKCVIISEYGCGEPGGNKDQWITNAFNTVRNSGNYNKVYAMIYFDVGGYSPDFRLNTSTAARSAYNAAINFTSDFNNCVSGGINPTCSITSPANRATYIAPASITINATAIAPLGRTITKVDFYCGTTFLGTDNTSPYSYTWSSVATGSYSITAKATDNTSATVTSPAVSVIINNTGGTHE